MDPVLVGWIGIAVVIGFVLAGLPVAFAMFIAGAVGHLLVVDAAYMTNSIKVVFYNKMSMYPLSVIPLFILMGLFAFYAGFAGDAFEAGKKWVGRLPGGLAQATMIAGAVFGAACGTVIAACAALGKVCIPAMRETGIDEKLAIGTIAEAATLSVMIPPSVLLPLYAIITEQSIGKLLIAGIIPGIVDAAVMMVLIYTLCKVNPQLAPTEAVVPWKERLGAIRRIWGIALIFLTVMGCIYTGVTTPTEAAAAGAAGALGIGLISRRLSWRSGIVPSLIETVKTTCTILIICVCALYFSHFLLISQLPENVSLFLVNLEAPRLVILIAILAMYLFLGCIMDTLSSMLLTLPIIFTAMVNFGYDPIWFGVIIVHMAEIGALTPPFGLNLFTLKGVLPEVSMGTIIRSVVPFIGAELVALSLYIAFPQIVTFLPEMMW